MSNLRSTRYEWKQLLNRLRIVLIPATVCIVILMALGGANRSGVCLSEMRRLTVSDFHERFEIRRKDYEDELAQSPHRNRNPGDIFYPNKCCIIIWPNQPPFTDYYFGVDTIPYYAHQDNLYSRWWGDFSHYRAYSPSQDENWTPEDGRFIRFYAIDNCGDVARVNSDVFTLMYRIVNNKLIRNWNT